MLRQTGIKVEFVEEFKLLISTIVVLLNFDHFLQLLLNLKPCSLSALIYCFLFNFVLGHLCSLNQCIYINDFSRVTLQGLKYLAKVLTSHEIFFHHVQQSEGDAKYYFRAFEEKQVPHSVRDLLWQVVTKETYQPLECN